MMITNKMYEEIVWKKSPRGNNKLLNYARQFLIFQKFIEVKLYLLVSTSIKARQNVTLKSSLGQIAPGDLWDKIKAWSNVIVGEFAVAQCRVSTGESAHTSQSQFRKLNVDAGLQNY
jgi:hypothetical protein